MLLRVFEELWQQGISAHLLIAGRATAEERNFVEKLRRHTEQGSKLLTLFDANDQELAHVYAHARALVVPSLAEGFGLPLVEARARGCPVIASDLPAFFELQDLGISFFPQNSEQALTKVVIEFATKSRSAESAPVRASPWRESAEELLSFATVVRNGIL